LYSQNGGKVTFTVQDHGFFGQEVPLVPKSTTYQVHIFINRTQGVGRSIASGALIGVTTAMSAAVYGAYKAMKKRKLIPEDADPWANDELFDASMDNPIYSGHPTTSTALYQ